jgi:hypothetical protein
MPRVLSPRRSLFALALVCASLPRSSVGQTCPVMNISAALYTPALGQECIGTSGCALAGCVPGQWILTDIAYLAYENVACVPLNVSRASHLCRASDNLPQN